MTSSTAQAYRSTRLRTFLIVVAIIVVVVGAIAWYKLFREVDQHFDSMDEYFKYGSIGTEQAQGVPYWIWLVLPRLFPEYLPRPGGYNALGLYNEPGKEIPVGFSVKTIGFDRVGINCAVCHSSTIRLSETELPVLYLAGGTNTFDGLGYQRFLFACGSDPRFTADNILSEIDKIYKLSLLDRILYRFAFIPATKKAFIQQKQMYAWTESRPVLGAGPHRSVQPGQAQHSQCGCRRYHWKLRHGSDLEPGRAAEELGLSLGRSEHRSGRGHPQLGDRRRGHAEIASAAATAEAAGLAAGAEAAQVSVRPVSSQRAARGDRQDHLRP